MQGQKICFKIIFYIERYENNPGNYLRSLRTTEEYREPQDISEVLSQSLWSSVASNPICFIIFGNNFELFIKTKKNFKPQRNTNLSASPSRSYGGARPGRG
jgi:hypothetical protein